MTTNQHNFLLNTENYEPLVHLVADLNRKIKENEAIIGRITLVVDSHLRFPDLPVKLPSSVDSTGEADDDLDPIDDQEEKGDYLRHFLDLKYNLSEMEEDGIPELENQELRQLIVDNVKLIKIRRAKEEKNRQLLVIYQKYELLLAEVILPTLSNQVSEYNIKCIQKMITTEADLKLESNARVWDRYAQYMGNLEKTYELVRKMQDVLDCQLDNEAFQKVELQLTIVEQLMEYKDLSRPTKEIID